MLLVAVLPWLDVVVSSVLELEVDRELALWLTVMNPLDDGTLVDDEVVTALLKEEVEPPADVLLAERLVVACS